mgnify:CR=1 FL=1
METTECDTGYTEVDGVCFKINGWDAQNPRVHTMKSWENARQACVADGAILASIKSQAQNDFITNNPAPVSTTNNPGPMPGPMSTWIGITD